MIKRVVKEGDKQTNFLITIHFGINPIKGGRPPNENMEI